MPQHPARRATAGGPFLTAPDPPGQQRENWCAERHTRPAGATAGACGMLGSVARTTRPPGQQREMCAHAIPGPPRQQREAAMRTARPMQMAHATPGPPGTAGAAVTDQSPIHIVLRGQPRAWKRPNPNRAKPGKFYTASDDDFFHGLLRSEAARVMADLNPIDGPIELSLLAVFKIAKTWPKWKR